MLWVCSTWVKAKIGCFGRSRESRRAESPERVKVARYGTSSCSAISLAARVMAPPRVRGFVPSWGIRSSPLTSVA